MFKSIQYRQPINIWAAHLEIYTEKIQLRRVHFIKQPSGQSDIVWSYSGLSATKKVAIQDINLFNTPV